MALKKTKDEDKRLQISASIQQMADRMRSEKLAAETQKIRKEHKKAESFSATQGKQPYYLKESDERKLRLLAQYDEKVKKGPLDALYILLYYISTLNSSFMYYAALG